MCLSMTLGLSLRARRGNWPRGTVRMWIREQSRQLEFQTKWKCESVFTVGIAETGLRYPKVLSAFTSLLRVVGLKNCLWVSRAWL